MTTKSNTAVSNEIAETADQYLTFLLGDGEYGVKILQVQEIKSWGPYTPLPNSPDYLLGVINLRGSIVPIIDLRIRFNLEKVEYTSTTAIIIVHVEIESHSRIVGLVVDLVSDVHHLAQDAIQSEEEITGGPNGGYIKGLGQIGDKMVILINLEPVVSSSLASLPDTANI